MDEARTFTLLRKLELEEIRGQEIFSEMWTISARQEEAQNELRAQQLQAREVQEAFAARLDQPRQKN